MYKVGSIWYTPEKENIVTQLYFNKKSFKVLSK